MRIVKVACCVAALAALTTASARGDEFNKKTFLTFSGPVQIPGTTLPAGTYVFQLADLESNRHVVQIFGKEDGKLIATFLTIPDTKLTPSSKPVVMFEERPRGMPQAIKAWWYPGDTTGDEFVYPKHQALEIARATHQPVLAMNDDTNRSTPDAMKGAKVARVNENDDAAGTTASTAKPSAPPPSTPAATGTTAASAAAPRTSAEATSPTVGTTGQNSAGTSKSRKRLPQTASELGLLELLGAASFAGFLAARQLRKRFTANV
jgi:hypothetical protein